MTTPRALVALTSAVLVASIAACSRALPGPGSGEADRIVDTVATAVAHPPQDSVGGLVRAIRSTSAGRDGRLTVTRARALRTTRVEDPYARLELFVHLEGSEGGFGSAPPTDHCYVAEFNVYGLTSRHRMRCPDDLVPAEVPLPTPTAHPVVPHGSVQPVRVVLESLPAAPTREQVLTALRAKLPSMTVSGQVPLANGPLVDVRVDGSDVGIALFGSEPRDCLIARRLAGRVEASYLTREEASPGELSCDGATALAYRAS